jgi:hypothetical protein
MKAPKLRSKRRIERVKLTLLGRVARVGWCVNDIDHRIRRQRTLQRRLKIHFGEIPGLYLTGGIGMLVRYRNPLRIDFRAAET